VIEPLLDRGYEVHATTRTEPPRTGSAVTWHRVDLLAPGVPGRLAQDVAATHLLHLAWCTEHGAYWTSPDNLAWVGASLELVDGFRKAGGSRAVVAGTCAEYEWADDCCGPGTPLRPSTLYGVSKNALREIFFAYARATGLSAAWGRIFFTYGPGEQERRVVAAVARAVIAGEAVPCSSGTQLRDFLYVADVAGAFAEMVDGEAEGTFDIGSGEAVALRDVLDRLERIAGRQGLVRLGEAPDRDEPARIVADPAPLASAFGWRPRYDLDDGLERTLAWWRTASLPADESDSLDAPGVAGNSTGGANRNS
jgi:nucleoside-diphosphate-sugar epimerase